MLSSHTNILCITHLHSWNTLTSLTHICPNYIWWTQYLKMFFFNVKKLLLGGQTCFFFSFGNEIFKQNVLHITISWITINWFYFMKHIKYLVMHILDQPTISHKSMSNNCLRHISYTSFFICAWTKWLHKSIYKKP
jgi:hypothetical protein